MKTIKYLPIGTICTLKGDNKKIMIVGYYSISYNGVIKMYDYSGILYPEGLLMKNRIYSFNHTDIASIEFVGFVSDEYNKLNLRIQSNKSQYKKEREIKTDIVYNFKFDENGVVVYDPISGSNYQNNGINKEVDELKKSVINPFQEKYNNDKKNDDDKSNWTIFKNKEE